MAKTCAYVQLAAGTQERGLKCNEPVARWCTDCDNRCGRGYCVDHLIQADLLGCPSVSADGLDPGPKGPER